MATKLEIAEQRYEITQAAINALKHCSQERQKLTHEKHPDPLFVKALEHLDLLLTGDLANLYRAQTTGR